MPKKYEVSYFQSSCAQCAQLGFRRGQKQGGIRCLCEASGESCPCSFLVAFARENDFFFAMLLFSSLLRFYAAGNRVEIENSVSLDSVQKRREADNNYKFTKYLVKEITQSFCDILGKICLKDPVKFYKDLNA